LGFRFGRLVFVRWASPILNIYIYANRMQVRTDSSFRSPGPVRLKTAPCSDQGKRAADSGAWLSSTWTRRSQSTTSTRRPEEGKPFHNIYILYSHDIGICLHRLF
jgi:hypothetical protein